MRKGVSEEEIRLTTQEKIEMADIVKKHAPIAASILDLLDKQDQKKKKKKKTSGAYTKFSVLLKNETTKKKEKSRKTRITSPKKIVQ